MSGQQVRFEFHYDVYVNYSDQNQAASGPSGDPGGNEDEQKGAERKRRSLHVAAFEGTESLSSLFSFHLELADDPGRPPIEEDLCGARAELTIISPTGRRRRIIGFIRQAMRTPMPGPGAVDSRRWRYEVELVSPLVVLAQSRHYRIFQDINVVKIAERLLSAVKLQIKTDLLGTKPPARPYCVQYDESDLAFMTRILAEEGISYALYGPDPDDEPDTTGHGDDDKDKPKKKNQDETPHLRLFENTTLAPGIDLKRLATVTYRPQSGQVADEEHIQAFAWRRKLRPDRFSVMGYDFQHPKQLESASKHEHKKGNYRKACEPEVELALPDTFMQGAHGNMATTAARRLQAFTSGARIGEGMGTHTLFRPGTTFTLTDHPGDLDGKYLLLSVYHEGHSPSVLGAEAGNSRPDTYFNRFECISADIPYRPEPPRRPHVQVMETATVTGAGNEDIHTDKYGRIRVRFHWDRAPGSNASTSCWIRVAQAWAGQNYGFSFTPRVGTEVVVGFLHGDPDLPLVIGSVHNGACEPPYPLPAKKTRSTLRTAGSSGQVDLGNGPHGYNEISFEDARGKEELYLHAQRDMKEKVGNDRTVEIEHNDTLKVGKKSKTHIVGSREEAILGKSMSVVRGKRVEACTSSGWRYVRGKQTTRFFSDEELYVRKSQKVKIGKSQETNVGKNRKAKIAELDRVTVGKHKVTKVEGGQVKVIKNGERRNVTGDQKLRVSGKVESSADTMEIKAAQKLVLSAGASKITLCADGTITLEGMNIQIKANQELSTLSARATHESMLCMTIKGLPVRIN